MNTLKEQLQKTGIREINVRDDNRTSYTTISRGGNQFLSNNKNQVIIKRGEIWMVNLSKYAYVAEDAFDRTSIQTGERPCIILQNNLGNRHSPTVQVIPLSSVLKNTTLPTHVYVDEKNGVDKPSIALCEQQRVLDKTALMYQVGYWTKEVQEKIEEAVMIENGIELRHKNEEKRDCNKTEETNNTINMIYINKHINSIIQFEQLINKRENMQHLSFLIEHKNSLYKELKTYCEKIDINIDNLLKKERTKTLQSLQQNKQYKVACTN